MGYPNPQLIQPGAAQHLDNLAHLHEDKVEQTLQNLFGHSDAINLDAVETAGTGQYFQQALEVGL
ncbi:hypothetical protein, partial [Salmonella enterica]|uniref:hypothetical protein n=1 Tax=Salmonella enterica TaxID=28901 RepID=UPI0039EB2438